MFLGIFGMDSTVAKIYELFDKFEDIKNEPIEIRAQKEQRGIKRFGRKYFNWN